MGKKNNMVWNDSLITNLMPSSKRQQFSIDSNCGLYLFVEPSGKKTWYCRYRANGKQESHGLGIFAPDTKEHLPLIEAKAKAINVVNAVKCGRLAENANITFRSVAEKWLEYYSRESRPATLKAVENRFKLYVETASFYDRNIENITRAEICYLFDNPAIRKKPQTAKRIYSIYNLIFKFATARGYLAAANPMPDSKYLLPKIYEQSRPAITSDEEKFGELVLKLKSQYEQEDNCAGLLLFLAYCFTRPGEARRLQWHHISLKDNVIKLSSSETKTATPLLIPIAKQVEELFERQKKRRISPVEPNDYIFFSPMKGPKFILSDATPTDKLVQLGIDRREQSAHGFRSCASTYLRECLNAKHDLVEMQLNHVVGTQVSRIYNHSTKLKERKEMMQRWADWVDEQSAKALDRLQSA